MDNDSARIAQLRKDIFLTGYSAGVAHLASAFSLAEIMYALYCKNMLRFNAEDPSWDGRDKLILSKGHGSLALYAGLCMAGFFDKETLLSFCKPGSALGGEPCIPDIPGVEASTGSLGHGLSIGVGMALAAKIDNSDSKTFVILGDGECQEGSVWEAVMSAASFNLDKLTVILDNNRLQKMGTVSDIMKIDSWCSRWESFGWTATEIDGHNLDEICDCLAETSAGPRVIIAHTVKGKGVSLMENNAGWHWRLPSKRELKVFTAELGISEEELLQCKKHI